MATSPQVWAWFTTAARLLFPVLALSIPMRTIRSLLTVPCLPEVWAYLILLNRARKPLIHQENILGRGGNSDVVLNYPAISRQHVALICRTDDAWTAYDLDFEGSVTVNDGPVGGSAFVQCDDVMGTDGMKTVLPPLSLGEKAQCCQRRRTMRPVSPWLELMLLTVFQAPTAFQLTISEGKSATAMIPLVSLLLTGVMWLCFLALHALRRTDFEMEAIAFFLPTLSLAVASSSSTPTLFKQLLYVVLGLALFLVLGVLLHSLDRAKKAHWLIAAGVIGLLSFTVMLYLLSLTGTKYGAANWLIIVGVSVQPSELAKICYISTGVATLDQFFCRRSLDLFILFTGVCLACLAYMNNFGTATILFVISLVITYLRSGNWVTLALVCGGGVFAIPTMLSLKPYILQRFTTRGHTWQNALVGSGYQQTHTMSAAASGGLVGVGLGEGQFYIMGTGNTDLVFGMLREEWGLIITLLAVLFILTLAVLAVRVCRVRWSSFYVIAAYATTFMMVFQTYLSVFGTVDILFLTGVTFLPISNDGTVVIASQGLLALFEAIDTQQNVDFAIRPPPRREDRREAALAPKPTDEWEVDDEED